jgi:integrase
MKRRHLTDEQIRKLPRKTKRYTLADPELIGHYLRIPARKSKAPITFVAVARRDGKPRWTTLGTMDTLRLSQARERARRAIGSIQHDHSVASAAEDWLRRQVRAKGFRTVRERERIVERHIIPSLGSRAMSDVRKDDLTAMLDRIEDESGAPMADAVLRIFRAIARFHHQRREDYQAPATSGMWRVSERTRKRILTDAEIKAIWNCDGGAFGAMVKLALLTAQRRDKVRTIRREDIQDGVWVIRTEEREKGNPGQLRLPRLALDVIAQQPRVNEYVFHGRGAGPIASSGYHKAEFDKLCGVKDWRVHDLRRTARSLMARAGVISEHAERVMGHKIAGVEGVYDRHHYQGEMADALTKLADLIKQIMSGPQGTMRIVCNGE